MKRGADPLKSEAAATATRNKRRENNGITGES
jgi:hypothetical protein